ncbi:MAG TPA: uroporphyrinogen-III C-methyltransferase, partial [Cytophagales bacterium]|nr:uroporphyrinogen-III C-methyltransferase [Cytophagales bacterium]
SEIVEAYTRFGNGELPVAIISNGSRPEGQVLYGTLDTIEAQLAEHPMAAPGLIIIGETVTQSPAWTAVQSIQTLESV